MESTLLKEKGQGQESERRTSPRFSDYFTTRIFHPEWGMRDAVVLDISAGGIKIFCPEAVPSAVKFEVALKDKEFHFRVPVRTVWKDESRGGYMAGCQFLRLSEMQRSHLQHSLQILSLAPQG